MQEVTGNDREKDKFVTPEQIMSFCGGLSENEIRY